MWVITDGIAGNDVDEEIDGAEKYWKDYLESGDPQYREMAHDELRHAGILIKKHLAKASDTERAFLNEREKKRMDMLKVVSASKAEA